MSAPPEVPSTAAVGATPDVVIRPYRLGVGEMLRESWRQRALMPRIGIRATVKGYSSTRLGRTWLVLRPTLSIFAMSLLFGAVLDAPSNGVPYALFLLAGMFGWMSFERFVFWATRSFNVYRRLAANLRFPLLLVPTASAVPAAIELSVIAGLTLITALVFWATDGTMYLDAGPESVLVVAGLALSVGLAWGLGLWLSVLNAMARDVRLSLRYVLMVWMYVTPVIYPVSALPEGWRFLATINPVAAPVELIKEGLLGAGNVELDAILVSIGVTLVACVSGLWFFARVAPIALGRAPEDDEDDDEEEEEAPARRR
jgi:lipopolysaccharide transport system permease protein